MAFKFESLKVWQRAVDLSGEIADLIKNFPVEERYTLSSQIQRAADSVSLSSAIEVVGCLYLGKRRGLINLDKFEYFYNFMTELIKGIQALRTLIK